MTQILCNYFFYDRRMTGRIMVERRPPVCLSVGRLSVDTLFVRVKWFKDQVAQEGPQVR